MRHGRIELLQSVLASTWRDTVARAASLCMTIRGRILVAFLFMSVITAVGAAGVPGGSLPLLMVVLATVGLPPMAIGVVLGVDRILDMCRTTVNVIGDLTATAYVARTETDWDPEEVNRAGVKAPATA